MICENCGTENPEEHKHCMECGHRLQKTAATYIARALLYRRRGGSHGLGRAVIEMTEALKLEPENARRLLKELMW